MGDWVIKIVEINRNLKDYDIIDLKFVYYLAITYEIIIQRGNLGLN